MIEETKEERSTFTQDDLQRAWLQFAEKLKRENRQAEYTSIKEPPLLLPDFIIEVPVTGSIQQDYFEKVKPELHRFLRQTLGNDFISLRVKMITEPTVKRLFTNREKFDHLAEKYPNLLLLKEKLGLESDF